MCTFLVDAPLRSFCFVCLVHQAELLIFTVSVKSEANILIISGSSCSLIHSPVSPKQKGGQVIHESNYN